MTPNEELFEIAAKLKQAGTSPELDAATKDLDELHKCAHEAGRAFSGSWLGYHSRVYYEGLEPPPPGAAFDAEWGLMHTLGRLGSHGQWIEMDGTEVKALIRKAAGDPDLDSVIEASNRCRKAFDQLKSEIVSILSEEMKREDDPFVKKLLEDIEPMAPLNATEIAEGWNRTRQVISRDMRAINGGTQLPPHIAIKAEVGSIRAPFQACDAAADIARKAASHLERKSKRKRATDRIGTNVFIGHGRCPLWREVKEFVAERLKLPPDEFNRLPVAGVTNIARLSEMLDAAAIAFIIMTAEDETADGKMQARMNVIHEVGLFQGRLGFTRAIVLLEEGCEPFTNIEGLGQIRSPKEIYPRRSRRYGVCANEKD